MKITHSLHHSYLAWENEHDNLIHALMSPNISQRTARKMQISASSAESLASYLNSKKIPVEYEYADILAQAKITSWKHLLVNGPKQISSKVIETFIEDVEIELRSVQKVALHKTINSAFTLNAAICGSGKTLTTILNSFFYHKLGKKVLTIIACPVNCISEYKKEIQKYRGAFRDFSIEEFTGASIEETKEAIRISNSDILVVSLNSIDKLASEIQQKISNFDGETIFVVEEGHFVKEVKSARSKGAQLIAPLATKVIVNTATPMPKGPKDIRGILSLVGIPLPVDEYANGIPMKDFETLKGISFVSDEEDLPYGPLCTQYLDYMDLHELEEKMLKVVSEELKHRKVVIFCSTNNGLEKVWSAFPNINKTVLSGSYFVTDCSDNKMEKGNSYEFKQKAIEQFNHDDRCKLIIANYRVGSTGVNLQHSGARLAFFFEISNNGADFFQARFRIRRPFIFPEDGFLYYFARSQDVRKRHTEDKQFAKLINQQTVLREIKNEQKRAK